MWYLQLIYRKFQCSTKKCKFYAKKMYTLTFDIWMYMDLLFSIKLIQYNNIYTWFLCILEFIVHLWKGSLRLWANANEISGLVVGLIILLNLNGWLLLILEYLMFTSGWDTKLVLFLFSFCLNCTQKNVYFYFKSFQVFW